MLIRFRIMLFLYAFLLLTSFDASAYSILPQAKYADNGAVYLMNMGYSPVTTFYYRSDGTGDEVTLQPYVNTQVSANGADFMLVMDESVVIWMEYGSNCFVGSAGIGYEWNVFTQPGMAVGIGNPYNYQGLYSVEIYTLQGSLVGASSVFIDSGTVDAFFLADKFPNLDFDSTTYHLRVRGLNFDIGPMLAICDQYSCYQPSWN